MVEPFIGFRNVGVIMWLLTGVIMILDCCCSKNFYAVLKWVLAVVWFCACVTMIYFAIKTRF